MVGTTKERVARSVHDGMPPPQAWSLLWKQSRICSSDSETFVPVAIACFASIAPVAANDQHAPHLRQQQTATVTAT